MWRGRLGQSFLEAFEEKAILRGLGQSDFFLKRCGWKIVWQLWRDEVCVAGCGYSAVLMGLGFRAPDL